MRPTIIIQSCIFLSSIMLTLVFYIIFVAKHLECYEQLPEQLAEGQEKAMGLKRKCRATTNYCWKTDTPAGIGQGCGGSDLEGVFSLLFGQLSDSCNTISFGDSYTGCTCHGDMCNTATIVMGSNGFKAGLSFIWLFSLYLRPTYRN